MFLSSFLSCALALGAAAQSATTYTEPKSGITVSGFSNENYTFGIALPMKPMKDFIGVMIGKGKGYAGVSLGGEMTNKLLIASWPSGNSVKASFRMTPHYGSPPVSKGPYSMTPIASGTYMNSTHYTYTFLCKNCILDDGTTFMSNTTGAVLGWAYASQAPMAPSNTSTPLARHDTQGNYGFNLTSAQTAMYDKWAALANSTMSLYRMRPVRRA